MKLYSIALLLSLPVACLAMQPGKNDSSVIPNASYFNVSALINCMTKKDKSAPCEIPFYTASGDEIAKVSINAPNQESLRADRARLESKLDSNAPKPQAATYAITYWEAHPLPFGLTKGLPGYFIEFFDKHGHSLFRDRYDEKTGKIGIPDYNQVDSMSQLTKVDASNAVESGSDEIKDRTRQKRGWFK